MKKLYTHILLVIATAVLSFGQANAQQAEMINAIKKGSAAELSKFFDDNIEVTLPAKSDTYSKAQAQLVIKDFFTSNEAKGFELIHTGNSPGGKFFVGTLTTKTGKFRTHVFIKLKNDAEFINQIRIQPQG